MNNPTTAQHGPLTATIAYYVAFIALGMTTSISGPALPWLAENTSNPLDKISIIFIAGSLGYMLGSQLGGRAYDILPGHRLQAMSLLLISLAAIVVPLVHTLWFLVVVLFILGAFQAVVDVGGNTLLTWIHGDKVGPFMNGLHFFFGVGAFLAPLIFARVVLATDDIQWAYWFFALISLPISIWFWFLPSPPIRIKSPTPSGKSSISGIFLIIVFFFVCIVGLEIGFGNWIYTYSTRLGLANETSAAYLTSAFWGAFTVSRLLGIVISSRLRPQTILLADLIGCALGLLILILWPISPFGLWFGTIVIGFSIASAFATGIALAEQRLRLTGSLTGWILVGSGIAGMVFPWLIGQLFERIGPQVTMPILLVITIAAFFLLFALILSNQKTSNPPS